MCARVGSVNGPLSGLWQKVALCKCYRPFAAGQTGSHSQCPCWHLDVSPSTGRKWAAASRFCGYLQKIPRNPFKAILGPKCGEKRSIRKGCNIVCWKVWGPALWNAIPQDKLKAQISLLPVTVTGEEYLELILHFWCWYVECLIICLIYPWNKLILSRQKLATLQYLCGEWMSLEIEMQEFPTPWSFSQNDMKTFRATCTTLLH